LGYYAYNRSMFQLFIAKSCKGSCINNIDDLTKFRPETKMLATSVTQHFLTRIKYNQKFIF